MDWAWSAEAGAAAAIGGEVQQGKHLLHRHLAAYLGKIHRGHGENLLRLCKQGWPLKGQRAEKRVG